MSPVSQQQKTSTPPHSQLIEPDQLLVATPYADGVIATLNSWDIAVASGGREDEAALGLTRLILERTAGADPAGRMTTSGYQPTGDNGLDVSQLLMALRTHFGKANEGWTPVMGKNRTLDNLQIGGGSVIFGGEGDPVAILGAQAQAQTSRWQEQPTMPGTGIRVGIIDTQLFPAPQLAGHYSSTYGDVFHGTPTSFSQGHAAFVAGVILSEAPGATIEVRGVLNHQGRTDSWTAAKAIAELGSRVDILNLSFSCVTGDGRPPLALAAAVDAITPRVVVVAAAGNHGAMKQQSLVEIDGRRIQDISRCASFPAALDNVVAVGAADENGVRAHYSPDGPWIDLMAEGRADSLFLDWEPFVGFASWAGTSFAAARVTGAIAARANASAKSARAAWTQLAEEAATHPKPAGDVTTRTQPVKFLPASPWWKAAG